MKNEREIKYFSMFTGVGGFELGLESNWKNQSFWKDCRQRGCKSETSLSENKQCATHNRAFDNKETRGCGQKKDLSKQGSRDFSGESNKRQHTFSCVGFSEIDKYASELLAKKFPTVKNYGDCTKIKPEELPDFDMLCGGFPCQSFSIAGKRRGFNDTRGTMFFEIARIVKIKRPKIVFLENVKGLLNHEKGKTFKVIIQKIQELGYDVQWMVLNSKFFGVPQNRERVFIIGSLRGTSRPEILPFRNNLKESCEEGEKGLELEYDGDYQSKRIYSDKGVAPTIPVSKTGGNHIPFIKESDKEIN